MSRLNSFLDGLRVLDVSAYIPGPLASLMLADMGADVIKIEPPSGDGMQQLGPKDEFGVPVFHAAINAGKKSSGWISRAKRGANRSSDSPIKPTC